MIGRAAGRGELAPTDGVARERAAEMEDRLRIDGLALRLPATHPGQSTSRLRTLARPLRALRRPRGDRARSRAAKSPSAPPAGGTRRWLLAIAAPNDRLAARWGDWHFACALARAIERRGDVARVRTRQGLDQAPTVAPDTSIVIRGLQPVHHRLARRQVLWIISHPESMDRSECDAADLVVVASERFADHLRSLTDTPVEVLLQATDPYRFRPLAPDPRYQHQVVVVAKTRDVRRAVVTDAIEAGLRPAVYGTGWRDLIDPSTVVADYVPNAELPIVYSSAGVVLNDHWESMREWGFVSNRLFDVIACGTYAISDDVPGVEALFGDAVGVYRDPRGLRALVEELSTHPDRARRGVARARSALLAHHTFDRRVDELVQLMARHGLDGDGP